MKKSEVDDAIASLWVLVHETDPIVIGSQALHGKYPDVTDSIRYSREVDVILPNKAKLGNWLVDVVGDGTPFEAERGYYIDHVLVRDGLPVLADGWDARAVRQPMVHNGVVVGHVRFLSPEDLAISKLGASRPKDFEFVYALISRDLVRIEVVAELVELVPEPYRSKVQTGLDEVRRQLDVATNRSAERPGGFVP